MSWKEPNLCMMTLPLHRGATSSDPPQEEPKVALTLEQGDRVGMLVLTMGYAPHERYEPAESSTQRARKVGQWDRVDLFLSLASGQAPLQIALILEVDRYLVRRKPDDALGATER